MTVRYQRRRDPVTGRVRKFWIVDILFQHPDGRWERVRKVSRIQTRRGAEQYEHELRASLLTGTYGRKEPERIPDTTEFADEFLDTYAMSNNKPSEVEAKRSLLRAWIKPHLGKMPLDEIGVRDVEALKAAMLKEGRSPKRVNNCLTVLNRMLKYGAEVGILESVPRIKFVKVPPQDFDFLDFDEYGRLLEAAAGEPAVQAAIITAGDGGFRLGEIRALKWSRVDFVARQLTVAEAFWRRHIGSPKGGRIGNVPMTQRLTEALRAQRHLKGEFVFCNAAGEPWTRDWMDDALKRQCRHAELREIGWHVLRHSFCSHLAMQGALPKAIMELARHTSLGVTQRYMHLSPKAKRDDIELLDQRPSDLWQQSGNREIGEKKNRKKTRG